MKNMKKVMKKIFSFQNITIILLVALIILLTFLGIEAKKNKMKTVSVTKTNYTFEDDKAYCQKQYLYSDNKSYVLTLCDGKLYIVKNDEENIDLSIINGKDIFSYYSHEGRLFYILTIDGYVYELTEENITNDSYEFTKLDLENIINIKDFYIGIDADNAYNYAIYAIDSENALHLIKK